MADTTEVDLEQDVLRYQMEESREALAQKIEQLEEKVTETVQSATATVAEATATVMETVQNATASVTDTVDSVTTAVQGTVDSVRSSVEGTVDTVKDAFDLQLQVRQHPWLMLGGAAAVGYFAGKLLQEPVRRSSPRVRRAATVRTITPTHPPASYPPESAHQDWNQQSFGARSESPPDDLQSSESNGSAALKAAPSGSSGWLAQVTQAFGPEITKLQTLAVSVALGAMRDMLVEASPQPVKQSVGEIIDGFTEKLGGKPIAGSALTGNSSSAS